MCETLDEIHETQIAYVIEKLRRQKAKQQVLAQ
jgi:hypothetical protein